jgi:acyl-CoA synthetase (AMP-forming)/AMP-acid ligase II
MPGKSSSAATWTCTDARWLRMAAPLSAGLAEAVSARLGCEVAPGYGLTETSPVTHAARAGSARL